MSVFLAIAEHMRKTGSQHHQICWHLVLLPVILKLLRLLFVSEKVVHQGPQKIATFDTEIILFIAYLEKIFVNLKYIGNQTQKYC